MKTIIRACLAVAALAGAPAGAADFTFEIPLTVENVPNGAFASVSCFVSKLPLNDRGPAASAQNVVGRGDKRVELVNGAFRGRVVVEFNAESGKRPAEGKSWKCYLASVVMTRAEGGYSHVNAANPEGDFERLTGMRVARLAKEFSGPLP